MLKNLTLITIAGLFVSTGCVITTNPTETESGTNVSTSNPSTEGTGTESSGTEGSGTEGSGTEGSGTEGTSTTEPTTTAPTTTESTTSATTSATTTEGTTEGTTGGEFGNCGWDADNKYYGCGLMGADPDGISPIECPEELPVDGDPCDEMSAVNNVGCCLPDGTNYYCSAQGMIVIEACGS